MKTPSWISVDDHLPDEETPVLVFVKNRYIDVGALYREHPTYEETFNSFPYWDHPEDEGRIWEWFDITHWMPLPDFPGSAL